MKPFSVNKSIRTPFLLITSGFVMVGFIGLFFLVQVQKSLDYVSLTEVRVEKFYRNTLSLGRVIEGIGTKSGEVDAKDYLGEVQSLSQSYHNDLDSLRLEKKQLLFNQKFFVNLLYDKRFNYSEIFTHLGKIQKAIIHDLKKFGYLKRPSLKQEFNFHLTKVLDSSTPLVRKITQNRAELQGLRSKILWGTCLSFSVLLMMVFFFVYIPWKRDYQYLEQERSRLQGVIKESEIRGNTFSWEVNYATKLTKRSNFLSGIFELENDSPVIPLVDEVKMFSQECQKKFLAAFDNCVSKGEILDVQVDMVTKNKKRYWLHYYAKRKDNIAEPLIVGTVRDITQQKLAEKRFRTLFENLQVPALIFGEGQIKSINDAALTFFGVNDSVDYDKLHPAILFPLYQLDGRSSLEKLKTSLGETKEGKTLQQDWLFQVNNGREVAGLVSLFNIPFPEVDLHMMVIHDDSKRFEFERRLVDMSRKALHARRSKLEYVTQVGIILDELVDLVNAEITHREQVELGHVEKLNAIKKQLEYLWGENINQGLREGSHSILTDMNGLISGLNKRWNRVALQGLNEVIVDVGDGVDQYLWLDSLKLKLALNNLVHSAITYKDKSKIVIKVNSTFSDTRHGSLSFLVMTDAKGWIQSDWTILNHVDNKPVKGLDTLTPKESVEYAVKSQKSSNFISLVELLQGEVFFDQNEEMVGIGFSCSVERVIGVSPEKLAKISSQGDEKENMISPSDIWSHFGGDWDIIENTTRDFFEYYPIAIADMYYYLKEKDGEKLEAVATDFYGVITHFPFFTAIERVVRIQKYSRYLRFDKVEFEIEALSHEISVFHRALQEFLPQHKSKMAA